MAHGLHYIKLFFFAPWDVNPCWRPRGALVETTNAYGLGNGALKLLESIQQTACGSPFSDVLVLIALGALHLRQCPDTTSYDVL